MNRLLSILLLLACTLCAQAQRTVTPVESKEGKPKQPTLHYYDKHGNPLEEPVLFLQEDTVTNAAQAAKPVYPALYEMDFGLNFFDGILALAGQKHGGADVYAQLSMWNWLFPTLEMGVGYGKDTPDPGNFTYTGKLSPYFKLGADYNFLYKSNPRYRVIAGLRACYSPFRFDVTDISISSDYWDQTNRFDMPGQSAHAFWGEVLAGIRVNIYKQFSLVWTMRYHFFFKAPETDNAAPWYIPGYGARNSHISATFSVIYTLPLQKKQPAATPDPAAPSAQ